MRFLGAVLLTSLSTLVACGSDTGQDVGNASELPFAEGSAEALAIVAVANDASLGVAEFDAGASDGGVGLDKRAATNLVAHRDGADATPGTADDDRFDNLTEIYGNGSSVKGISYCKLSCVQALLAHAKATGVFKPKGDQDHYVIFSPQPMEDSHIAEVAATIDTAEHSVDIAMYSYSHGTAITDALERALQRGVKVRFLADTALANSSSKGKKLEEMGIDVRRVTKVMHHKFAIIDGPRDNDSLDLAATARIASGSGNWSSSAATSYDENTMFLTGYPEMALKLQRDFDTIWAGSKDKVYESFTFDTTHADITDGIITDNPDLDVFLTSYNFKSNGNGGWSALPNNTVSDALVEAIYSAETSIHIASGHFRSEPVADALVDKLGQMGDDFEVKIILDGQETSAYWDYAKAVDDAGADIRFKYYGYRWHYKYAKQMHHKYLIVDGTDVYSGSYNYSDNAEHNTFENVMMFRGGTFAGLVADFEDNFATVRGYGRDNDVAALDELRDEIENGDEVPLFWDPIAIDYDDVSALKKLIKQHCPAADYYGNASGASAYKSEFTNNPGKFYSCDKDGTPWD